MKLWYEQPASEWMQALPIGNGSLGAMVFGTLQQEQIALDEDTIWSGFPFDNNKYDAPKYLDEIRQLLFTGQAEKSRELAQEHFTGGHEGYGTQLRADELIINTGNSQVDEGSYKRQLDLQNAVASVEYSCDGIRIEGADAVTLLLDINSSFRSDEYLSLCQDRIAIAAQKSMREVPQE